MSRGGGRIPAIAVIVLAVAVAACSRPLENVGEVSRRVVHGGTSIPVVGVPVDNGDLVLALRSSEAVAWLNESFAEPASTASSDVIRAVWNRSTGFNQFVQASPREIALALPGIRFPEVLPESVEAITSQLVYEVDAGDLDVDTAAAFGMWTTAPYSVSRDVGQSAVLRVGIGAPSTDLFSGGIAYSQVEEGLALAWFVGDYRYELFCRTGVSEELCTRMAESMVPLTAILP